MCNVSSITFHRVCFSHCWSLFIIVPQVINELLSQHWTKKSKIVQGCCTWLKIMLPEIWNYSSTGFPVKTCLCFLAQYWLYIYTEQFSWECCLGHWQNWLGNVWNAPECLIQYCIGYFPHRCLSAMGQHCTNNLFHTALPRVCSYNIDEIVDCRSTMHR